MLSVGRTHSSIKDMLHKCKENVHCFVIYVTRRNSFKKDYSLGFILNTMTGIKMK